MEGRVPPSEREAQEELELPVELPAEGHLADRNEQKPLVPDFLTMVAIGLLFASIVVVVVYFANSR